MKKIIISAIFIAMTSIAFAQKVYVDPNVRTKKGLIEPGQVTEAANVVTVDKKESDGQVSKSIENDPVKKRYCACFNSKRLSEKRKELATSLYHDSIISGEEYGQLDYYKDVTNKEGLLKKFSLSIDIDTDDIECDLVEVSAKKPKDFKKPLEELDKICKFDEIERKKI